MLSTSPYASAKLPALITNQNLLHEACVVCAALQAIGTVRPACLRHAPGYCPDPRWTPGRGGHNGNVSPGQRVRGRQSRWRVSLRPRQYSGACLRPGTPQNIDEGEEKRAI